MELSIFRWQIQRELEALREQVADVSRATQRAAAEQQLRLAELAEQVFTEFSTLQNKILIKMVDEKKNTVSCTTDIKCRLVTV